LSSIFIVFAGIGYFLIMTVGLHVSSTDSHMAVRIRQVVIFVSVLACGIPPSATLAAAASAPRVVHRPVQSDPPTLDPQKAADDEPLFDLFEGLTIMSASNTIVPGMATSWEASADGLTWTFHLRDANWSDGTPVTAEDFVYSLRRAVDPATACPYLHELAPITEADEIGSGREKDLTKLGVQAPDPHTVRFSLNQPTPWLPAIMAIPAAMPVQRQTIEKWGDRWAEFDHIVVNGPFMLKRWVPLGELDFVRNPGFHDAASVKIDEVQFIVADDARTALMRYEAGEFDLVPVRGQDLPHLARERPTELTSSRLPDTLYLAINMKSPLGADARIRRALAMVIDRDVLEIKVVRGGHIPAYTLIPPEMPGYTAQPPAWAAQPMADRIAEARHLLAEAGAPTPFKVHILAIGSESNKLYASAIQEMWHSALGVETELETGERNVVVSRFEQHDFEMAITDWTADYLDPSNFLETLRSTAGDFNGGDYANPDYDSQLDRARATVDPDQRMKLLEAAEALMLADQPIIPIHYVVTQTLVSPRLHGWEKAMLDRHPDRFLSIDEGRG
jgi:oligopeptide transport system substrate-binding protein